jgi:hypothetical protein
VKFALSRRGRGLLLFLSAAGYIAWFSGLGDRIEAQPANESVPPVFAFAPATAPPNVAAIIARDPFAGGATPSATVVVRSGQPENTSARAIAGTGGDVVPNIGEAGLATTPSVLAVRATIVGANAVAYVENGSVMDIVRVGDSLGDERVATIDLRGIAFADGTRLDLPDGYAATPAPAHAAPSAITLRLNDLRKLLAALRRAATTAPEAAPSPVAPSAAPSYPTPAPLATVDARGIPVGVNPTSDPNAPTPFPYPYPYAPRR